MFQTFCFFNNYADAVIIRPHRMHASHKYGLVLQMSRGLCVCVSACLFVTTKSCAKTAEPISGVEIEELKVVTVDVSVGIKY